MSFNQLFSKFAFIQTHQTNFYLEVFEFYMYIMSKSL